MALELDNRIAEELKAKYTSLQDEGKLLSNEQLEKYYSKPRHGGFTYPGNEDDRCPIHQDGGKIFLCSEQTNVAHPTLARAAVDRYFPASHRDSTCRCT